MRKPVVEFNVLTALHGVGWWWALLWHLTAPLVLLRPLTLPFRPVASVQ